MFKLSCVLCYQNKVNTQLRTLCSTCFKKLVPASNYKNFLVSSLYVYEHSMRELILRVKIAGDHLALNCLKQLWLNTEEGQKKVMWADCLMPAPSSLWSRVHGRFDLAYLLCHELSKTNKKKLLHPPKSLYWRWQKRSLLKSRLTMNFDNYHQQNEKKSHLLIIDDVLTTGYTLNNVAKSLNETYNLRFLTLARASK